MPYAPPNEYGHFCFTPILTSETHHLNTGFSGYLSTNKSREYINTIGLLSRTLN